jgi:hypothetical protein
MNTEDRFREWTTTIEYRGFQIWCGSVKDASGQWLNVVCAPLCPKRDEMYSLTDEARLWIDEHLAGAAK